MLFSIEWGLGFVPRGSVRLILWQQPVHTLFSPLVREMLHLCCCFCDKDPPCQLSAAEDYCLCSDLLLVLDKSMSASFSQNLNSFWLWSGENEKREHSWLQRSSVKSVFWAFFWGQKRFVHSWGLESRWVVAIASVCLAVCAQALKLSSTNPGNCPCISCWGMWLFLKEWLR